MKSLSGATGEWIKEHDLRDLFIEYRDKDTGKLNYFSSDVPRDPKIKEQKYQKLDDALVEFQTGKNAYKQKFIKYVAPEAEGDAFEGSGGKLERIGQRLYGTPKVLIAASFLDPRDSSDEIPENPLSIDIDTSQIPPSIEYDERDDRGPREVEIKSALLVDQLSSWDEDTIHRKIVDQGIVSFADFYRSIETTIIELTEDGDIRRGVGADFQTVLDTERERIKGVINTFIWETGDIATPFELQELNNQVEAYEEFVDEFDEQEKESAREYATVKELDTVEHQLEQLAEAINSPDASDVDNSAFQDRLDQITNQLQAHEEQIEQIETKSQTNEREIEDLTVEFNRVNRRVQEQIDDIRAALDAGQPISNLEDKVEDLEGEVNRLRTETNTALKNTADTIDKIEKRISDLEIHRDELQEDIDRIKAELNNSQGAEVQDLLDELEHRKDLLNDIEERIEKLESENNMVKARLEEEGIDQDAFEEIAEINATTYNLLARSSLSRFESSLRESHEFGIYIPDTDTRYDISESYDWASYKTTGTRAGTTPDDPDTDSLVNTYWEFEVTTPSGIIGRSTKIAFESVVYGSPKWFDGSTEAAPTPLTIDQLCKFLEEGAENDNYYTRAENASYPRVLCIIAPTGVSDSVREALTGDQRWSRIHPNLSVCIADLQAGELIYDDRVAAIDENRRLFDHFTAEDEHAECKAILEELSQREDVSSISMSEMQEEHGFPTVIVYRVFKQFQLDGKGDLVDLDEYGLEFQFR